MSLSLVVRLGRVMVCHSKNFDSSLAQAALRAGRAIAARPRPARAFNGNTVGSAQQPRPLLESTLDIQRTLK